MGYVSACYEWRLFWGSHSRVTICDLGFNCCFAIEGKVDFMDHEYPVRTSRYVTHRDLANQNEPRRTPNGVRVRINRETNLDKTVRHKPLVNQAIEIVFPCALFYRFLIGQIEQPEAMPRLQYPGRHFIVMRNSDSHRMTSAFPYIATSLIPVG